MTVITPSNWGPHGWKFIHYIAIGYPNNPSENDKQSYKSFFSNIARVLPCSLCSNHYSENLLKHPLNDTVMSSRDNLVKWSIDMHNEVNIANNRDILSYDEGFAIIKSNFTINKNVEGKEKINDNTNIEKKEKMNEEKEKMNENKENTILFYLFIIFVILIIVAISMKYR